MVTNQSDTGCLAAWVQLDAQRLEETGRRLAVNESDDEGHQTMYARTTALEQ